MAVWITGARGFIGRHVARRAASLGHEVVGLGHGAWAEDERRKWGLVGWVNGDVSNTNLDALAASHGVPEHVLHLAGGSAVAPSFAQPVEDFRRSVHATVELAEWLRMRAPKVPVVMASSAAVYGAGHASAIAESATCEPFSPYGFHKRMAELALESYARNFGLRVGIVRLFSIYGPGLQKQLLWDACCQLASGAQLLRLGGTGHESRDWLHVEDAARLLLLAGNFADESASVVNGGTGEGAAVHAVARQLCDSWGAGIGHAFSGKSRPGDPSRLVADATLARRWGFVPEHSWHTGVAEYVKWFRARRLDGNA